MFKTADNLNWCHKGLLWGMDYKPVQKKKQITSDGHKHIKSYVFQISAHSPKCSTWLEEMNTISKHNVFFLYILLDLALRNPYRVNWKLSVLKSATRWQVVKYLHITSPQLWPRHTTEHHLTVNEMLGKHYLCFFFFFKHQSFLHGSNFFSNVRDFDGINRVLPRPGELPVRVFVDWSQKQKTGLGVGWGGR